MNEYMSKKFHEIKQINHPKLELDILQYWKENNIFEQSIKTREDGIPFTFYEGPPTANGKPGIHHVMARTVKDLFCRYRTLKGYRVERKAGWDTHGLPVEIEIEKQLGLEGRSQVEAYGLAKYNNLCRESVLKYKDLWDQLTERMGYWVDLTQPYITFTNDYIESCWWAVSELHKKGFLYKGYKIQWYSPGSGTVLSSHEVSQGYKDIQDPSVYVKFKSLEGEQTYFAAWTTTPWTLVSNMALTVNPNLEYIYAHVKSTGDILILAKALAEKVIGEDFEIVREVKGSDLLGKRYEPLFNFAKDQLGDIAWKVIPGDFVTLEDGTGIVHTAPAFGADDYAVCNQAEIPMFNPIDREGKFTGLAGPYAGYWFKDADKPIIKDLKERGLMIKHVTYTHNYPHDWRKGTPLISYPVDSWFIKTSSIKDKMVELNKKINWKPESTGSGRFGTWLENNVDWAISRQRFWGTPIPIWVNDKDESDYIVIGSLAELEQKSGKADLSRLDLHRPSIDDITWDAPNGGTYRRIPDLLDVWFDSGAMPFAQHHFPIENKDIFKEQFPADFIAEGVDQTRGWFYTLHALGTMLFDKPAYLNVVSTGLVLDEKGEKMSKTKGNTVDPFKTIDEYGSDLTRWYMMSNSAPWENLKFSTKGIEETQRKFFNTVTNTYAFFAMYANIDGFEYDENQVPAVSERAEIDRWIISRLNTTIKKSDSFFEQYEPTRALREIEKFTEELSNWYVRRNRRRFWKTGNSSDKTAAYTTLYECLLNLSILMASAAPFMAEWLYQQLAEGTPSYAKSVHLAFFPTVEETAIDKELEFKMERARLISSIVLRIRNQLSINVRQPLARIILPISNEKEIELIESVKPVILEEVNIKTIEYVSDDSGIVEKTAKPDFSILGKKLGKKMKAASVAIKAMDTKAVSEFEKNGKFDLLVDNEEIMIELNEIEIVRTGLHGWSVESEDGLTVALDTAITEELKREGLAREFINRVQNMRKDADFDVTDRIEIHYQSSNSLATAIESMKNYINDETLSTLLISEPVLDSDFTKSWEIESETIVIGIKRSTNK